MEHPDTPLPPAWNPSVALEIEHPVTPLTNWKLRRAAADAEQCLSSLPGGYAAMSPLVESDECKIDPRLSVTKVGEAALKKVETTCAVALRMAMWERHTLQPAATMILGSGVSEILHLSSYNCRPIRTAAGEDARMSTHATAEAIDVTGFVLNDGRRVRLDEDWSSTGPSAKFLRAARDGACEWFQTTLGPDYNSLHRDHFHLQSRGWGLCR